ncbi:glutamate receptor ionotropic, kainate 2 isoform X2 [Eurytemora carolleeae]|uniref:glutamate receptor ionotropic, kainate 2 isoform X2 n=1 Tax=Eurytemora carolleeae TaxID=1294199 RepID=UPI000C76AD97|nr:glutamate receptor ionotropic, kainate 2 isoform X2 [Eurytemora carolleeae]|eukprot:XP_023349760.1 glutamate receptor ionotropic, kainate 2-like isoform X2 [Eurytemora affinis]
MRDIFLAITHEGLAIKKMMELIYCVFPLTILPPATHTLPNNIRIGGFFEEQNSIEEIAFKYAVDHINRNRELLPRSRVMAQIERIPKHDSFYASKRVCAAMSQGVAALFGPSSSFTAHHVQSICDAKEIPHIETRWDLTSATVRDQYSINLYPYPLTLRKAYLDLLSAYSWKSFTILYEDNEGLIRLQDLLKLTDEMGEDKIVVRQLRPGPSKDYRPLLKEIKNAGTRKIILDCVADNIQEILRQAQQVGMMTAYHNYIITSLDLHMVEMEDFKYGGTNITAFRLVNPSSELVQGVVREWIQGEVLYNRAIPFGGKSIKGANTTLHPTALPTETALVYDAALLFAKALNELDRSQDIQTVNLDCESEETWQHGNSLINYMKLVEMDGLTGKVSFDAAGFRSNFNLEIVELRKEGLTKVGSWESGTGTNFSRNYTEQYSEIVESLHNKTLIVSCILNDPFLMLKEDSGVLVGNDRYEGYSVDLIHEIAGILGFNYTIKLVEDGSYGSYNKHTGKWNGMIGELLDQKADLVVADITITYEREQGVDFTMPFMNLGVTILYKKPNKKDPNLFSFMSPLSIDVWIYILTAYLAVSLILYTISRLSPYEPVSEKKPPALERSESGLRLARQDPLYEAIFTCTGNPVRTVATQAETEVTEPTGNTFTVMNSFWFIAASLLGQGVDVLPSAFSTRMIAGLWWFFTLIMISSYTANLAAFLTVERMESPIESAEDLARQQRIKYGAVEGGSTAAFFRKSFHHKFQDSKITTYAKMWAYMDQNRNVFTKSNKEGIERVLRENGDYAFLMESTIVEYVVERKCELTQIGGLLDSKGYGIGLPPNSPYRTPITSAILQLQEGGKLHLLKEKWWKRMRGGGQCTEKVEGGAAALGIDNVGGIFLVLLIGLVFSCLTAIIEFSWSRRKSKAKNGISVVISNQVKGCCVERQEGKVCREWVPGGDPQQWV